MVQQLSKRKNLILNELAYSFMTSGYRESPSLLRFMTTSRRVQDRSKKKRVHDLEIATEKWKLASKVLFLMEVLKREPEQIIPLRSLEQYRRHISLPKPHKISDFIRKSPKLFELYKDHKRVIWCGMTKEADNLVEEEAKILEEHGEKAAEHVTRLLMMTVDKRLSMDKIAHFRRDFGLPYDFRTRWAYKYPQCFRVVKSEDDVEYLELVSWNPAWAVTELEKKVVGVNESTPPTPGLLTLPFPMKFPQNYKKIFRYGGKIEHFQKRSYLSPYADARGLKAGSQEFDKRAVAVMHELLSFTIEKRVVTDHLTHFRQEIVMPQKLMRLLLKHFGIFYVSERGKRFNVFLTEAYEGSELIQKCPLVLWKEKVQALIGYRGRQRRIESFSDFSDMEGYHNLFDSDFKGENAIAELESEDTIAGIEDLSAPDHEMEVRDIYTAYTGS
ncbi:protein WHAT'S THIS FACTOR 1 homolog, chloroplastic-like [Telopea speciosissima]|uniref:protein WHAT'S THIS FACTOR 1 homolog, chloroplastic-like n=1 Tax=Telopea speciosissima TaxID=54955 RepID=UPI001CC7263C|nr:protein WHAT'S THIS FACTOR 1 homolog, chloroplastic-like [Telopea speciosissima]